ncbi:MAG: ABC transporter ATP-binding protein [Clostridia bacterium]
MKNSMLLSFMREHKWKYILGVALLLCVNLLQLATPKITGEVVDKLQEKAVDSRGLLLYGGIILSVAIMIFILNFLSRLQIIGSSNLFDYNLRNKIFKHLESLSMSFFHRNGVGDLMALSVNDVSAVRMALGRGVMLIADTTFLLISSILIMIQTISLELTLIASIPFPILVYFMLKFGTLINRRFRRVQESFADLTRKAQENISGIRVIKAFAQEDAEIMNFKKLNEENYRINMELVKVWGLFFPLIGFISALSYLAVLVYGGILVVQNKISLGDFVAFNSYIGIIIRPIRHIGMLINVIQRGKASMERIQELLQEKPEIYDEKEYDGNPIFPGGKMKGRIEIRDLTFSYRQGEKPVLKNINLTLEPGKTLAVVGKVGSGKSTLVNLLLRLYNPERRGQILIDGVDIMDIPLEVLRKHIGYVPQDNFLFSDSIRNNIRFSPEEFSMDEVEEAAKASQVYDNIMEFPQKFDTILGERGVNLSGGQKQRISIARALIKDPAILILDDCLSAVDTQTEERILEALREIMKHRTSIMIAHRISTIKHADEIIVLDKGEIIERGTHQELLDKRGYYHRMYERQLLEDKVVNA